MKTFSLEVFKSNPMRCLIKQKTFKKIIGRVISSFLWKALCRVKDFFFSTERGMLQRQIYDELYNRLRVVPQICL